MRGLVALATVAAMSLAAFSGSSGASETRATFGRGTDAANCRQQTSDSSATAVPGVGSDWDLTSFDGTTIRVHWFPNATPAAERPLPTVLMGPGWGQAGDTNVNGNGVLGAIGIKKLHDAGYNVLTWDPRGFGKSGGTVEVDSPDHEGRDVQKLLDWVAEQPGAQIDRRGDPRVGMTGGSYGGGIQLIAAAIDCRVDAIVPAIAWHSLTTSLYKAEIGKAGWASVLDVVTRGRSVDPHVMSAYESTVANGRVTPEDVTWFAQRGPGELVEKITAPTLIVQGTVDNLFTLDEGIRNFRILRGNGVPTALLWYCGGHGVCLTNPGDPQRVANATIAWLDRYVKGDAGVKTGARFDFVDQNGTRYTADEFPVRTKKPIEATGEGTLALTDAGGSGPAHPPADSPDRLAGIAGPITPARAPNAVNVSVDLGSVAEILVGAPRLTLRYRGTVPDGDRPTRVFAQLVDDATGVVVGNQVTPIEVTLDGRSHRVSVPLEVIAFSTQPGGHLTLQVVATTVAYAHPRLGGSVRLESVRLALPVASGVTQQ